MFHGIHHPPLRLAFQVIRGILKVSDPSDVPPRRLERYWREIDLDCSGTVDFEEFVIWIPGGILEPEKTSQVINGCFNQLDDEPNLYIENGCLTKHPFLSFKLVIFFDVVWVWDADDEILPTERMAHQFDCTHPQLY